MDEGHTTHHVTRVKACDCNRKNTECKVLAMYISRGINLLGQMVSRIKLYTISKASTNLSRFNIAFSRFLAEPDGDVSDATTPARLAMNKIQSGVTIKSRERPFRVLSATSYKCTSLQRSIKKMKARLPLLTDVINFSRPSASRVEYGGGWVSGLAYCS